MAFLRARRFSADVAPAAKTRRALAMLALAAVCMAGWAPQAGAQAVQVAASGGVAWSQLNPAQRRALEPLASQWANLSQDQQRSWLAMAANFQDLSPAEQATLHGRMREWAAMSPQQRAQARQGFGAASKVPADERKAKWETYRNLPPEQRERFGADAPPAPAGAARALRQDAPAR